jgi:hypothetical protein
MLSNHQIFPLSPESAQDVMQLFSALAGKLKFKFLDTSHFGITKNTAYGTTYVIPYKGYGNHDSPAPLRNNRITISLHHQFYIQAQNILEL